MASTVTNEHNLGWLWNATLGARVGLLRYGARGIDPPDGFQIDVEGAADMDLDTVLVLCTSQGGQNSAAVLRRIEGGAA